MRFLVADDHSIVRMGIRLMLEADYANVIIDEAASGDEIVEQSKAHSYDLMILDFQMPNTDTFSILGYLLAKNSLLKILFYSMATEKIFAAKLLKAGAKGFLSKEAKNTELLKAVATILNDGIYENEPCRNGKDVTHTKFHSPFEDLSNKELDILAFLIQGKTTKEISNLANLQLSTVSTHKFRIFRKLKVNNIVELIALSQEYPLNKGYVRKINDQDY